MTFVRKIDRNVTPSPFSNHILIESVHGGYQASGVVIVNRHTKHLSSILHRNFDDALREAMAWSKEDGIPEIFVVGAVDADRT